MRRKAFAFGILILIMLCVIFTNYSSRDIRTDISSAVISSSSDWIYAEQKNASTTLREATKAESFFEQTTDTQLEISYTLFPRTVGRVTSETFTFFTRCNALPFGLNKFCPTASYVYEDNGKYDTFLDIHIREKEGSINENFCHMSWYTMEHLIKVSPTQPDGELMAQQTYTTESFHDAADFYKKNFAAAEAGTDPEYISFNRLEDIDLNGVTAYHYTYKRDVDPDVPQTTGYDLDYVYERYGEHFLFETERYIYLIAFSGQEENEFQLQVLKNIIDTLGINPNESCQPPVWAQNEWFVEYGVHLHRDELVGTVPECLQPYVLGC